MRDTGTLGAIMSSGTGSTSVRDQNLLLQGCIPCAIIPLITLTSGLSQARGITKVSGITSSTIGLFSVVLLRRERPHWASEGLECALRAVVAGCARIVIILRHAGVRTIVTRRTGWTVGLPIHAVERTWGANTIVRGPFWCKLPRECLILNRGVRACKAIVAAVTETCDESIGGTTTI